jgi:hypothetical protein
LLNDSDWSNWLTKVAAPTPFASWTDAFQTEKGLAKRHNIDAFLSRLVVLCALSKDPALDALRPAAQQALRSLPD